MSLVLDVGGLTNVTNVTKLAKTEFEVECRTLKSKACVLVVGVTDTDGYFNDESTLCCISQIHNLPHSCTSNNSRYLHWLENEPLRNHPLTKAASFGPWYVIGLIKFIISFYGLTNCVSSFF